jgi:3-hydroxyisobutyryl-CoA hydrolase
VLSLYTAYTALTLTSPVGGGVGLAIGAPFRVATEKAVFAMPETKIGYCPDVGASFFLSRMDGEVGTYLALTSDTLTGREVL